MRYALIDHVLERSPERVRAVKNLSSAEEYLADHFPTFPVMPGVLMIEAAVQAARVLLAERGLVTADRPRWVLCGVRALKYGRFIAPGDALLVEVSFDKEGEDGSVTVRATGLRRAPGPPAAAAVGPTPAADSAPSRSPSDETSFSGRIVLRPLSAAAP